ncbi:hypothetical protein M23134_06606 [Microscilla marina ATCC 23134]|uniref:Uncharacterized protein n=1 Tax=Microscilla marina ATCC 23134 TaxID=313606 RepID=A1ZQZ1_MICM2|nr:hypothetical protein M23134_06606 [Microscilla marina ATCC 23134]
MFLNKPSFFTRQGNDKKEMIHYIGCLLRFEDLLINSFWVGTTRLQEKLFACDYVLFLRV